MTLIRKLINQKQLENKYDAELLYQVGMRYVIENIEFYFDKPYTCESVLTELFERGIEQFIEKEKANR
jgi:hypothetical protein